MTYVSSTHRRSEPDANKNASPAVFVMFDWKRGARVQNEFASTTWFQLVQCIMGLEVLVGAVAWASFPTMPSNHLHEYSALNKK